MATSDAISGFGTLIKIGDGGVGAGAQAYVAWGTTTASIRIKWRVAGVAGNGKNITVVVSGASYVKTILTADEISVTVPTTAKVSEVIAWLYQDDTFQQYWEADYNAVGDGTGTITARTVTATASGSDGTEIFTTISEVQSINFSGITQQYIDVTHMESPSGFREEIPTFKDPGTVDVQLSYVPSDAVHQGILTDQTANTLRNFRIYMPDNSFWAFSAYIANFGFNAPFDGKLSASLQLKIKGATTPPA